MGMKDSEFIARRNIQAFTYFRMFFSARFYYPVYALLFLDFGLSLEQFGLLNGIWAATIVLCEVPSGALADTLGRRTLLIVAGVAMLIEMGVLLIAPINGGNWLFVLFIINRLVSGLAEAAASGADEALAYDSLKAAGLQDQWGHVLERVQRDTSIAFFFAMMTGAAVYDPAWVNKLLSVMGMGWHVGQADLIKLPIFLTFLSAMVVLFMALRMREKRKPGTTDWVDTLKEGLQRTVRAGHWIWITPLPFAVILVAVLMDSPIRLFLTLASSYWESIELPVASFGLIGSAMALMGMAVPALARRMTERFKFFWNVCFIALLVLGGLWGLGLVTPFWGILPAVSLFAAMYFLNFFVSFYLNRETNSEERATVLSFKGLSTNLAYGATSLFYAAWVMSIRERMSDQTIAYEGGRVDMPVFIESLQILPLFFLGAFFLMATFYQLQFRLFKK